MSDCKLKKGCFINKDNEIAVIVSSKKFSSLATNNYVKHFLATNVDIVKYVLDPSNKKGDLSKYLNDNIGDDLYYNCPSFDSDIIKTLRVEWVFVGAMWCITYDDNYGECITINDDWFVA